MRAQAARSWRYVAVGLSLGAVVLAPSASAAQVRPSGSAVRVKPGAPVARAAPSASAARVAPSASAARLGPSPSMAPVTRAQELTTDKVRRNKGFKLSLDATNGPGGSFSSLTLTLERRSGGRGVGSSLETTIYRFHRAISFDGSANLASAQVHGLLVRKRGWIEMTFHATRHAVGVPVPKGCVGTPGEKRRGILRGSLVLNADDLGTVRLRAAKATFSIPPEISDCGLRRRGEADGTALETDDAPGRHGVYVYATKPARGGLVHEGVVISDTGRSYAFSYSYTALAPRFDYRFPHDLASALLEGAGGIQGRVTYQGTRASGQSSQGLVSGHLSVRFATIGPVTPLDGHALRGGQFHY